MRTAQLVGLLALLSTACLAQTGQPCHSDPTDPLYGLYCSPIKATFAGVQGSANATTVINGSILPITGTLTFIRGSWVRLGPRTSVPSYDIGRWDIVIGYTHFVYVPRFQSVNAGQLEPAADNLSNSGCGRGYSNSFTTDSGNTLYYICGDNLAPDNQGLLVLIFPTQFLTGQLAQANLVASDTFTDANGRTTVWESGLYLPPNSWAGANPITPNGSTMGALKLNNPKRK